MLDHVSTQLVVFHDVVMLAADHDCIHAYGLMVCVVLDGDLALAVRPQVGHGAVLAHFAQLRGELVCQRDRRRHQLGRLVRGIAKHHALVAGAAGVHAHRDVRRLRVDGRDDRAGIRVEAVFRVGVTDVRDGVADDLLKVDIRVGRDLARNDHQASAGQRFAGHAAHRVLRQAGVKNGIGDLVGNLVGMAFGNGFRRKQETIACGQKCSFRGDAGTFCIPFILAHWALRRRPIPGCNSSADEALPRARSA